MARRAKVVAAGIAHHVTQRGNRRRNVFFYDGDHRACTALLAEGCVGAGVWGYWSQASAYLSANALSPEAGSGWSRRRTDAGVAAAGAGA